MFGHTLEKTRQHHIDRSQSSHLNVYTQQCLQHNSSSMLTHQIARVPLVYAIHGLQVTSVSSHPVQRCRLHPRPRLACAWGWRVPRHGCSSVSEMGVKPWSVNDTRGGATPTPTKGETAELQSPINMRGVCGSPKREGAWSGFRFDCMCAKGHDHLKSILTIKQIYRYPARSVWIVGKKNWFVLYTCLRAICYYHTSHVSENISFTRPSFALRSTRSRPCGQHHLQFASLMQ